MRIPVACNEEKSVRFVRLERFVFKNQLARELLIGVTEHELHELHEYVA